MMEQQHSCPAFYSTTGTDKRFNFDCVVSIGEPLLVTMYAQMALLVGLYLTAAIYGRVSQAKKKAQRSYSETSNASTSLMR